jgi:two-component system, chemotaxis family, sensor kinase CheA
MAAPDAVAEVTRQLETLAMQVVLGAETLDAHLALLQGIHQRAVEAGLADVGQVSSNLLLAVRGRTEPEEVARILSEGVMRLQEAVAGAGSAPQAASPPQFNSLAQDPELVADFIQESREHLTSIETQVLALEQDPSHAEAIHSTFRSFHTIKGLAGFLEFEAIREVAHDVESLLDMARNGKLAITPEVIDVVLAGADYLGQSITQIERAQKDGGTPAWLDAAGLRHRIQAAIAGKLESVNPPAPRPAAQPGGPPEATPDAAAPEAPGPESPKPDAPREEAPALAAPASTQTHRENLSVRVDIAKLDYLVDMVGELVIAQAMVRHDPDLAATTGSRMQRNLTQLSRITSEVQKTTMSMRMVPVGQLFQRMNRLVRDLSRKAGKQVDLEVAGEDTELDKTIIEELADPLMHMVRNALDHGLETPEERKAAGKNPAGRVSLRAYHQAGHILIDVSDDGRGLNREKILKKAIQKELIAPDTQLADGELFNLIFEAGFSTAEKVTDISGRGVGMDVVRKQIQKLRGRVDIESKLGAGTTFHLRLPLTLAIIEGLVLGVGKERYIVPISVVQEMLRPTKEMIASVEGRHEMAMVRERLLPVVRLHQRFGVQPRSEDVCEGLLVVAEGEGKRFCLLVDEFIGKQEVVIKSLGDTLKETAGVAGGAILGDGRVGLILDMDGVFEAHRHA